MKKHAFHEILFIAKKNLGKITKLPLYRAYMPNHQQKLSVGFVQDLQYLGGKLLVLVVDTFLHQMREIIDGDLGP